MEKRTFAALHCILTNLFVMLFVFRKQEGLTPLLDFIERKKAEQNRVAEYLFVLLLICGPFYC
jgi:hypothetical protein